MLVATSAPTDAGGDSSAPMPRRGRAFLARAFISFSRKRKAEEAPVDIADAIASPLKKSSSVKRSASWRQKNTKKELPVEEAAGPAVRIAVRVRPFNKREKDLNSACCVLMPGEGKLSNRLTAQRGSSNSITLIGPTMASRLHQSMEGYPTAAKGLSPTQTRTSCLRTLAGRSCPSAGLASMRASLPMVRRVRANLTP